MYIIKYSTYLFCPSLRVFNCCRSSLALIIMPYPNHWYFQLISDRPYLLPDGHIVIYTYTIDNMLYEYISFQLSLWLSGSGQDGYHGYHALIPVYFTRAMAAVFVVHEFVHRYHPNLAADSSTATHHPMFFASKKQILAYTTFLV